MKVVLSIILLCITMSACINIPPRFDLNDLRKPVYRITQPNGVSSTGVDVSTVGRCLILTAAHAFYDDTTDGKKVVDYGAPVKVHNYRGHIATATLVRTSIGSDLALLEIRNCVPDKTTPFTTVARHSVKANSVVYTVGYPGSVTHSVISVGKSTGTVVAVSARTIFQDAAITHGSSGGPVFDTRRRIVGVVHGYLAVEINPCISVGEQKVCDLPTGEGAFVPPEVISVFLSAR